MSKVDDAKQILQALGMPPAQCNDNAAYTLLAFAGVGPRSRWKSAGQPRRRPHDVIAFAHEAYSKDYAENTRETIRRQAIHQFVQGGILRRNPDDPSLATNSPRTHYALSDEALSAVRSFGTPLFMKDTSAFRESVGGGLARKYGKARSRVRIPVQVFGGTALELSPGQHNLLQRDIVQVFLPEFAPAAKLVYLGDTDHKTLHVDAGLLRELGLPVNEHDKLPDVVAYDERRNWLFLVEAVTSHGPVSPKRHLELQAALDGCRCGLVYVSAFPDFRTFRQHADDIAWETEVWIAECPTHLLHYDGERFLGPSA
jgi:type II restriction enzyme